MTTDTDPYDWPSRSPYGEYPTPPNTWVKSAPGLAGPLSAYFGAHDVLMAGTILLVPGYTGSKEDFRLLVPELVARGWLVFAISRRGQADSHAPDDAAEYTLAAEAADVVHVARQLGRVHLVGHSLGGVIAAEAATTAPDAFASLTMLCSGPRGWANRKTRERTLAREQGNLALWRAMDPYSAELADDELVPDARFAKRRFADTSPLSLDGGGAVLEDPRDLTAGLAASGVRTLVAWGDADDAWPIPWQREMAARLGAESAVIANAGHSPNLDRPAETADVIARFCSEGRPPW